MDVWISPSGNVAVVAPQGEIDMDRAADMRQAVLDLLQEAHRLIVMDLAKVEFIDSTGLGVIAAAAAKARSSGQHVGVVEARGHTRRVLEITGLGRLCLPPLETSPA